MPLKGKRTTPGAEDDFLFVNEDSSTLSGGAKNADLDRSKQSHVQRRSFAKRKRSLRGGGTATSPTPPLPHEDTQSLTTEDSLASLASQSDDQISLPAFGAPNSLWLSVVPDESLSTAVGESQSVLPFDRSQVLYRDQIENAFPQQSLHSLQHVEGASFRESQPFTESLSPHSTAVRASIESFNQHENVFTHNPTTSILPDDPFDNVRIALEKWAPLLVRNYTTRMVLEYFHTDLQATSLHNIRHVEYLHQDMRSCMSDPAEMYALLAASCCDILRREGRLDLPDLAAEDSSRVMLLFKSKAFEALRLRLSRGEISQGTVLAIKRLTCTARYINDFSAVEAHYQAALSMIRTMGGLAMFNDFQKEYLVAHDLLHALDTGSPPRLELTWDHVELLGDVSLELADYAKQQSPSPGQRIRSIAESAELAIHPSVAKCIPELVKTQNVLDWLRTTSYRPAEYKWLAHKRLANIHRLLSVDSHSRVTSLDVVRLALLYYCIMVRAIPYSNIELMEKYVIPEVEKWGTSAMEGTFGSCLDLLLWIMVMFGIGTTGGTTRPTSLDNSMPQHSLSREQVSRRGSGETRGFDVSAFVAGVGRSICKTLNVKTEPELRGLMRTFLFDDEFLDDRYLAFATDGLRLER